MTAEYLTAGAAVLLSLVFAYVPGIKAWYGGKASEVKQLINLGAMAVIVLLVFGASCLQWDALPSVSCDKAGVLKLVELFVVAMIANYSTYGSTKYLHKSA